MASDEERLRAEIQRLMAQRDRNQAERDAARQALASLHDASVNHVMDASGSCNICGTRPCRWVAEYQAAANRQPSLRASTPAASRARDVLTGVLNVLATGGYSLLDRPPRCPTCRTIHRGLRITGDVTRDNDAPSPCADPWHEATAPTRAPSEEK